MCQAFLGRGRKVLERSLSFLARRSWKNKFGFGCGREKMSLERDTSLCNTYDYGDANYWDQRYRKDPEPFDWYQRYSGLAPLILQFIPKISRILMVGCGNAVFSEYMGKDGYQEIINIDISPVVVEMMQRKYYNVHQLKYLTMDVKDMSLFEDSSFNSVIDKGTLDSLMCGVNAPISVGAMLAEVSRILKPGGVFMLITYGQPSSRIPHLNVPAYNWTITHYEIPRPNSNRAAVKSSITDPIPLNTDGSYAQTDRVDDPDRHCVYVCVKAANS